MPPRSLGRSNQEGASFWCKPLSCTPDAPNNLLARCCCNRPQPSPSCYHHHIFPSTFDTTRPSLTCSRLRMTQRVACACVGASCRTQAGNADMHELISYRCGFAQQCRTCFHSAPRCAISIQGMAHHQTFKGAQRVMSETFKVVREVHVPQTQPQFFMRTRTHTQARLSTSKPTHMRTHTGTHEHARMLACTHLSVNSMRAVRYSRAAARKAGSRRWRTSVSCVTCAEWHTGKLTRRVVSAHPSRVWPAREEAYTPLSQST